MSPDVIDLLIASDLPFAWRMAWMGVMLLALAFILAGIWAVIEMVWEALPRCGSCFDLRAVTRGDIARIPSGHERAKDSWHL
jgi:hypothetical protein